jgi:hypothetical protein
LDVAAVVNDVPLITIGDLRRVCTELVGDWH